MSDIHRAILDYRRDMTDWLIHFTHDAAPKSARSVLRTILREGILRSSFAERGGKPAVYGPHSAVCFTEQPLSAFLTYVEKRANSGLVAGYGLLLHKHDVFLAGGLPAIYGLPNGKYVSESHPAFVTGRRIFKPEILSLAEQYRYVAFNPTAAAGPLDWTHEREWRWSSEASHARGSQCYLLGGRYGALTKKFRARVHCIVAKDSDIEWLQDSIAADAKKGVVGSIWGADHEYAEEWQDAIQKVRIVSLETVMRELAMGNQRFQRFDDLDLDTLPPLFI